MGWIWIWSWINYPALLEIEDTNAKKRTNQRMDNQSHRKHYLSLFVSLLYTSSGKEANVYKFVCHISPQVSHLLPISIRIFRAVFSAPSGFRLRAYLPASSLYMCNMFAYAL